MGHLAKSLQGLRHGNVDNVFGFDAPRNHAARMACTTSTISLSTLPWEASMPALQDFVCASSADSVPALRACNSPPTTRTSEQSRQYHQRHRPEVMAHPPYTRRSVVALGHVASNPPVVCHAQHQRFPPRWEARESPARQTCGKSRPRSVHESSPKIAIVLVFAEPTSIRQRSRPKFEEREYTQNARRPVVARVHVGPTSQPCRSLPKSEELAHPQ